MKIFGYRSKKCLSYLAFGVAIAVGIFATYKLFFNSIDLDLGMFLIKSVLIIFLFIGWAMHIDPDRKKEEDDNLDQNEKISKERIKIINKKLRKSFFCYTVISFLLISLLIFVIDDELVTSIFAGLFFSIFLSVIIISFQKYFRDRK